jgi:cyclic nucleotide-binding protein
MVLGFGQAKGASPARIRPDDVAALIAKKDYARAIAAIRQQLETQKHDSRLRLQLGDLLVLAGKQKEAVAILSPLADEFAREGFAAKAVAVLKKIQKIDPQQRGVDARLASLIQEKQKQATVAAPVASSAPDFGMEEIGFDAPTSGDAGGRGFVPQFEAEPENELSMPAPEPAPAPEPVAAAPAPAPVEARAPIGAPPAAMPAPVEDRDLIDETSEDVLPLDGDAGIGGELTLEPVAAVEPEPELSLEPEVVAEPAIELEPEPEAALEPMTESAFADELMDLVDGAFNDSSATPAAPAAGGAGNQIVVSPLFKDFSVDEMVAVIQGLNLITFEAGDIILTEGDPGDSLYMLTSGTVKAVKRNAAGKQVAVSEMTEGAFFGEISILTGQPRTATVVATSHCELLELDRATLDSIVATHPHVRQVLEQFSKERLARLPKR